MKREKSTKGITLIALVITIILLLILAGIVINLAIGEHGLINLAKDAKIQTEIASIKERIQTEILGKQAENEGNISDDTLKKILQKYGVLSEEGEKLTDKTLTTNEGNHVIKVADIFNGTTVKDASLKPYVLAETMGGANSPDISGFNVENTYYVTWGTTAPYQINETSTINNAPPSGWSNYTGKEWANVKTTGGGNDCYWVWIPRYAYCITEGYHTKSAGTIDIKFLQGTSNTPIDGSNITISNSSGSGNWNVHPAFWFDKDNDGIEDEGEQLTGIWVAKFEASSSDVNETTVSSDLTTTGGGDVTNLQVTVKPNVTSWRGITVNNIFTVCRNLTTSGNSLENTSNLDSHMMKNTEWGAVAYLSVSVFGKNGEVWNNPYYYNGALETPITGLCGSASVGKDIATTDLNGTCKYNETDGGNASTSGNVYGVYDMAGGAEEYVAGYLSEVEALPYFKTLAEAGAKYKDVYKGTSTNYEKNYDANIHVYGDAICETSHFGYPGPSTWFSGDIVYPYDTEPVFSRGGSSREGYHAGVFAVGCTPGGSGGWQSGFRPVVLSSQP